MAKYSYNGTILPALPNVGSEYTKKCICMSPDPDNPFGYVYCFSNDVTFAYSGTTAGGDPIYIAATASKVMIGMFNAEQDADADELIALETEGYMTLHTDGLTPIWTNFDIIAENGSVFLAASEPVLVEEPEEPEPPAFDLRSFLTGLALGLSGKPLPLANKEPIAYLYNGVQLPKLPESDLPYAVIVYKTKPNYSVYFSKTPFTNGVYIGNSNGGTIEETAYCYYTLTNGAWVFSGEKDSSIAFVASMQLLWANHEVNYTDIYNPSELAGTLYFAASYPIPVYE